MSGAGRYRKVTIQLVDSCSDYIGDQQIQTSEQTQEQLLTARTGSETTYYVKNWYEHGESTYEAITSNGANTTFVAQSRYEDGDTHNGFGNNASSSGTYSGNMPDLPCGSVVTIGEENAYSETENPNINEENGDVSSASFDVGDTGTSGDRYIEISKESATSQIEREYPVYTGNSSDWDSDATQSVTVTPYVTSNYSFLGTDEPSDAGLSTNGTGDRGTNWSGTSNVGIEFSADYVSHEVRNDNLYVKVSLLIEKDTTNENWSKYGSDLYNAATFNFDISASETGAGANADGTWNEETVNIPRSGHGNTWYDTSDGIQPDAEVEVWPNLSLDENTVKGWEIQATSDSSMYDQMVCTTCPPSTFHSHNYRSYNAWIEPGMLNTTGVEFEVEYLSHTISESGELDVTYRYKITTTEGATMSWFVDNLGSSIKVGVVASQEGLPVIPEDTILVDTHFTSALKTFCQGSSTTPNCDCGEKHDCAEELRYGEDEAECDSFYTRPVNERYESEEEGEANLLAESTCDNDSQKCYQNYDCIDYTDKTSLPWCVASKCDPIGEITAADGRPEEFYAFADCKAECHKDPVTGEVTEIGLPDPYWMQQSGQSFGIQSSADEEYDPETGIYKAKGCNYSETTTQLVDTIYELHKCASDMDLNPTKKMVRSELTPSEFSNPVVIDGSCWRKDQTFDDDGSYDEVTERVDSISGGNSCVCHTDCCLGSDTGACAAYYGETCEDVCGEDGDCDCTEENPCDCPNPQPGAGCDPHINTFFNETYEM